MVAFFHVPWLPPMERWHSGLLPYPLLLAAQIAIVVLMAKIGSDFTRRRGFFVEPGLVRFALQGRTIPVYRRRLAA